MEARVECDAIRWSSGILKTGVLIFAYVIWCAASIAQTITVKDQNGRSLPHNAIIDGGQELTIEYLVPGNTYYQTYTRSGETLFYDMPTIVRNDADTASILMDKTYDEDELITRTYTPKPVMNLPAAVRLSFGVELSTTDREGALDPNYSREDHKYDVVDISQRHDIWLINQTRPVNAKMALGEENENGASELTFSLSSSVFEPSYGAYGAAADEDNRPWISIYWQRIGGTAPDGSKWTLSEPLVVDTNDFTEGSNRVSVHKPNLPGVYTLSLVKDGWVIDSLDVTVPAPGVFDNLGETHHGRWIGYEAKITSAPNPSVRRGDLVAINFRKHLSARPPDEGMGDEEADIFDLLPSTPDMYQFSVLDPTIGYANCVADASELQTIDSQVADAASLTPPDFLSADTMQFRAATANLAHGTYQFAISGVNTSFDGSDSYPILAMGQFEVKLGEDSTPFTIQALPPVVRGAESIPAAAIDANSSVRLGRISPLWRNASGALAMAYGDRPKSATDADTPKRLRADIGLQVYSAGRELCFQAGTSLQGCFSEIIHEDNSLNSTAGLRQNLPAGVARRLAVEAIRSGQQNWPVRAAPAHLCGDRPAAADPISDADNTYSSPPIMAMGMFSEPNIPEPHAAAKFVFRVENKGTTSAEKVMVRLRLVDVQTGKPLEDFTFNDEVCDALAPEIVECKLATVPAAGTADLYFEGKQPRIGQFAWEAALKSEGDIAGVTATGGLVGRVRQPVVNAAFVDVDQLAILEGGVAAYGHPSSDRNVIARRRIFVVGKGLSDLPIWRALPSDDPKIRYHVEARSGLSGPLYTPYLIKGWKKYFQIEDGAEALARARREGLEGLMVSANFDRDVLPGDKAFKVDGVKVSWTLKFGDVSGNVRFVRKLGQRFEAMEHAFNPEVLYVRVNLSHGLPLDEIKAQITRPDPSTGEPMNETLTLKPVPAGQHRVYLSDPLELHSAGHVRNEPDAKSVIFKPDGSVEMAMSVRLDPEFAQKNLNIAVGTLESGIIVKSSPARGQHSYLWTDAIGKATACHSEALASRSASVSGQESASFTNYYFLVGKEWSQTQRAQIGHHAAAILLRDKYLEMSEAFDAELSSYLDDDKKLAGYHILLARQRFDQLENPIYKLKVKGEDGSEIEFWQAMVSSRDYVDRQSFHLTQLTRLEDWRKEATRSLIEQQLKASKTTRDEATDLGNCEVEDLLKFSGFSFQPVIARLKPELMTLVTRGEGTSLRVIWLEDVSARAWVDLVATLAADLKRQQRTAQTDTNLVLAVAGIVAMPLAFAETGSIIWYASLAFDAVDVGLNSWHELRQYWQSEQELTFAAGSTNILGYRRFNEAVRSRYSVMNVAIGIGMSTLGALGNTPDIVQVYRARQGYNIAKSLRTGSQIAELSESEATYLLTFAAMTSAKRTASGVEALTVTERKILGWFDAASESAPLRVSLQDPAEFLRAQAVARGDYEIPSTRPSFDAPVPPRETASVGDVASPANATDVRIPTQKISFTGPGQQAQTITVGPRIGTGATSEVFQHPEFPDQVIRITFKRNNQAPDLLDQYGERVLQNVGSEHVRGANVISDVPVSNHDDILRITTVEKLEPAHRTVDSQWARLAQSADRARLDAAFDMRIAQAEAYVGAMEDLNARGFVWLDNKPDNFAFLPKGDGSGRVEVVVLDPGGIFPISAEAAARRGMSQAELASEIQRHANGSFGRYYPNYSGPDDLASMARHRQLTIGERFGDSFDYAEMGIRGREQIAFMPYAGERFPYLAPFFDHAEIGSSLLETQRFRTFVPPAARDTGFGEVLELTETRRFEDFAPPGTYDSSLLNTRRFEEFSPPGNTNSALSPPPPSAANSSNPFGALSDANVSSRVIRAPPEGFSDFHVASNAAPPPPPATRQLEVLDQAGQPETLTFNTEILGQGSFNTVVGFGNDRVLRMPFGQTEEGADLARLADRGGRKMFAEAFDGVDDADVRLVTLYQEVTLASNKGIPSLAPTLDAGVMQKGDIIEILEARPSFSKALEDPSRPPNLRDKMTDAEAIAYDRAHRAMNEKGIVWLDNKFDNFAFEPHPNPKFPGQQRLVILDSGGLVAITGRNPQIATRMQSYVNGAGPDVFRKGYMEVPAEYRWSSKRELLLNEFGDQLDLPSIGLKASDMEDFAFNPMSVEAFSKARALSQLSPSEARDFARTYGRYRTQGRTREIGEQVGDQ